MISYSPYPYILYPNVIRILFIIILIGRDVSPCSFLFCSIRVKVYTVYLFYKLKYINSLTEIWTYILYKTVWNHNNTKIITTLYLLAVVHFDRFKKENKLYSHISARGCIVCFLIRIIILFFDMYNYFVYCLSNSLFSLVGPCCIRMI